MPVLIALMEGTPVITSNSFSIPEVTREAAVRVDPTSVKEIADSFA